MNRKEVVIKALNELPDDADYEMYMDRLCMLSKIERGLKDCEEGRMVEHDEAIKRLRKWLE